jgi:hypothetical protein
VTEGLHQFLLALPQMQQIPFRANRWGTSARELDEEGQTSDYEKELEVAARLRALTPGNAPEKGIVTRTEVIRAPSAARAITDAAERLAADRSGGTQNRQ